MNDLVKKEGTISERFTNKVMTEFATVSGDMVNFTKNQKRLCQHLFVKADAALKALETKRIADNKQAVTPYVWTNVNMSKLAIDSVHRIEIGLDALIPNHMSIIPYWNKKLAKYDIELQIGYSGKDFYKRKMAYDTPIDIIYELVYSTDEFTPIKKGIDHKVETYKFEIKKPFDRGDIVGGFGYIFFEDESKNKLVIVTEAEFKKSQGLSKTDAFWKKNPEAMRYKTIVNRTTDKLLIDPEAMTVSMYEVEQSEKEDFVEIEAEEQVTEVDFEEDDSSLGSPEAMNDAVNGQHHQGNEGHNTGPPEEQAQQTEMKKPNF